MLNIGSWKSVFGHDWSWAKSRVVEYFRHAAEWDCCDNQRLGRFSGVSKSGRRFVAVGLGLEGSQPR